MVRRFVKLIKKIFAVRSGKISDYFFAILGPLLITAIPLSGLFSNDAPQESSENLENIYKIISGPYDSVFYITLVSICLVAPLIEELLFRGILWSFVEKFIDKHYAFFATTILFAFAHSDPIHIVGVFPIGIYMGWLRLRSNSVFPSMLSHAVNNILVSLYIIML